MDNIALPEPSTDGSVSVEAAIAERRSCRNYQAGGLSLQALGQLCWAAQGITGNPSRRRAAPSAGGAYPIELFVAVAAGGVEGVPAGIYAYLPRDHALELRQEGDVRSELSNACLGQDFLEAVPVNLLLAADITRTADRYGKRADRYVHMEVGHIGQNVHLQVQALGLGTVMVGAFRDAEVSRVMQLEDTLAPLYVMPVGRPS
jgi:SagB-type dehydrogenase family enzyme